MPITIELPPRLNLNLPLHHDLNLNLDHNLRLNLNLNLNPRVRHQESRQVLILVLHYSNPHHMLLLPISRPRPRPRRLVKRGRNVRSERKVLRKIERKIRKRRRRGKRGGWRGELRGLNLRVGTLGMILDLMELARGSERFRLPRIEIIVSSSGSRLDCYSATHFAIPGHTIPSHRLHTSRTFITQRDDMTLTSIILSYHTIPYLPYTTFTHSIIAFNSGIIIIIYFG